MNAGDSVGPYRLLAELGSGGMGTVWRADGPQGVVALKVVHPHLAATPEFEQRFRREGEIGMRVRHENVVATLAVGAAEADGRPVHWLVMEYVEGRTLRDLIDELGRVPEELCRHVGREVAKGLAAIHASGAVHRDLKPDNVLITRDNVVKVMDLGVARETGDATRLSRPGAFVGSFHYAAPEQLASRASPARDAVDHRADLHALGVVLYELASGKNPYDDGDLNRTIAKILRERPRRLAETNPQVSPFLEELVMQLLEKDPDRRFASAADVAHVLDEGEESAWWLHRASAIRAALRRPLRRVRVPRETALYGRDAELAQLGELWERARSGEGQVVLVGGEDGIGKTRLVDEFVARREQAGDSLHFLHGAFPPPAVSSPASAFVVAFREQFGLDALEETLAAHLRETPLLVPAFAAHLRGDAAPRGAEPLTRESLQTLYVHATRSLAAERPTILLVDDLDFAPADGRALFAALALAVPEHRVMLIGAVRPGGDERLVAELDRRGPAARIGLARLGPKDLSRLLVDAFRSERLAEELAFQIAAKSDGNPFFVFEILRGLREGRFIERRGDGTWASTQAIREIKIPSSVQELVTARLGGLSADERNVLDVASCAGPEFDPLLVAAALSLPRMAVLQRLAWIEKTHRLVRSAGRRYAFDHNQIHETLYTALPVLLREEYHVALADALAARPGAGAQGGAVAAEIARHLLAGGRPERAAKFAQRAVAHLAAVGAHAPAAAIASGVLGAPGVLAGRERVDLLILLMRQLAILGRRDEERAAIDEALRLAQAAGDPAVEALVRTQLGWHYTRTSRAREAVEVLAEALGIAVRLGDRRLEASASGQLGSALWDLGRYEEARVRIERQLAIVRETGDLAAEAGASGNLGLVEYSLGRYAEARACHEFHLETARRLCDRRGAGIASANLGIVFTALGRFDEARVHIEAQIESTRDTGDRRGEAISTGNLGNLLYALGRWAEAASAIERGVRLAREIGDRIGEASALVNLGPLAAHLGDPDRATDALEAALAICRDAGARYQEGYALFGLGELAEASGDAARAAALQERALALRREIGHRDGVAESLVALARLRAAAGEVVAAKAHLDEAGALGRELGLAGVETLAAARLASLPGADAATALAVLAANEPRLMLRDRMEAEWLLGRATGQASHLATARRLLERLVANAPAEFRDTLVSGVPLHREVAKYASPGAGESRTTLSAP